MSSHDVFVIHVKEDERVALSLALALERHGYSAWCYQFDSLPGNKLVENIKLGVESSSVLAVVVSHRAVSKRDQVSREINFGVIFKKTFLPLLLDWKIDERDRLPEVWDEAFGDSVMISFRPSEIEATAKRIVAVLVARQLEAKAPRAERIRELEEFLRQIGDRDLVQPIWERLRPFLKPIAWTSVIVALSFGAWAISDLIPWPRQQHDPFNLGIVHATIGAANLSVEKREEVEEDYKELIFQIEEGTTQVFESVLSDYDVGFVDVEEVNRDRINAQVQLELGDPASRARKLSLSLYPKRAGQLLGRRVRRCAGTINEMARCGSMHIAKFVVQQISRIAPGEFDLALLTSQIEEALPGEEVVSKYTEIGKKFYRFKPASDERETPDSDPTSFLGIREAFAQDSASTVSDALTLLSKALEERKLASIGHLFADPLSPDQEDALREYFGNMDEDEPLKVDFGKPRITMEGDDAARASFLRVDRFTDYDTGKPIRLAIRLIAHLRRVDGQWRFATLEAVP